MRYAKWETCTTKLISTGSFKMNRHRNSYVGNRPKGITIDLSAVILQ